MRDATVFSIDPPGCEDIDDAMSVSRITPADAAGVATFEVGVHIADQLFNGSP
jgi:exoribonuclease R